MGVGLKEVINTEADILVEGFRASETTHGVRYMEVIGDGDSSVLAAICSQVIWGPYVKKLECANHACKNYRAKLESIVHDNPRYKGRGSLTQKVIRRLIAAARAANYVTHHFTFLATTQTAPLLSVQLEPRIAEEPDSQATASQPNPDEREMTPESDKDTHVSISDTMLGVIDEEIRTAQLQLCDESEARLCTVGVIDTLPSGLLNMVLAANSDRIVSNILV